MEQAPKLINQDKYVGIERSRWTPRAPMPLKGWAETISGKFSPPKPKQAVEVITLEHEKFREKTIYPKGFPVPIICLEFCNRRSGCHLRENGFGDLCKHRRKLGKLVMPVDIKWSARFNKLKNDDLKARTQFAKSVISGNIPEIALAHERTEDSTYGAYSSQQFLDSYDDPGECGDLEYTMDTGMVSAEKSQAAAVPSFMYRTTYRDHKVLLGFESRIVEKTYVDNERKWVYYPPAGRFILTFKKVIRTTRFREDFPIFKWLRLPTLRPIGCHLKPMKVISSTTIVTRSERQFYNERREEKRQKHHHMEALVTQDAIDARNQQKQVVMATC